jgi:hypothetical protein
MLRGDAVFGLGLGDRAGDEERPEDFAEPFHFTICCFEDIILYVFKIF